ncbi:MAG: FlgD immunoglobulin-like domain containing protein, partial [Calditrichota bacterium]
KAYENVTGPSAIAVDADARVFVAETGASRISVLQLDAAQENSDLRPNYIIESIKNPADIALHDNGTPLNVADDALYVADPVENKVLKYALGESGAQQLEEYDGFSEPTSVLVGRWDGSNNNLIYVIDKIGKRVQLFEDNGSNLQLLRELKGGYQQYFSGMRADHFGNIYLVDNVNSNLYKYSATLELLDQLSGGAQFEGLVNADIPFGRITVEGEGTTWAGFDQLFTLERWTENSGAQRRVPGLGIRNATFHADADISTVSNRFTITDAADVTVSIVDEEDRLVRTIPAGWMVSGSKELSWDRRNNGGEQVHAGLYRYQLDAKSAYGENNVTTLDTRFYLPLHYWQDAGAENDDQFRVNGTVQKWGEAANQTIVTDRNRIIYRFNDLNPESKYQVSVEAVHKASAKGTQAVFASKTELSSMTVSNEAQRTAWLDIPTEAYADGKLELSVARVEGESAAVSQLWLKESGVGLSPEQLNDDPQVAEGFALEQNYPNPFNPTTTIRFRIPEDARVKLEVFNLLGQKVATLVDDLRSAGVSTVNWNGRNAGGAQVSSGIYFYRLEAGSLVQTRQMLLIK